MNSYPFLEPPIKPGDLGQLGHYRVIDELGKGGMGYVFRAEDVKLKRAVALKVMNQKIASTPHSRRRFIREARAMAAVHHDNVATIFEVGESKGTPFMAMEMLRGSTLEDLNATQRRLGYDEIIDLARQMTKGLAAAHAKGIVHRDIKPANIWIEQDTNRVKILDFGLALADSAVDHLAGRGAVVGTPGYLSPEQAMSEPLDDRSDLYSLGVVLYELCTGQLPSDAKSVPLQLISILAHRPAPIGESNPAIPTPLCELIHRLLRKEPRFRPSSAKSLLEEFDHVEAECHVKSEVAQAINKLQLGLQEVVSKQSSSSIFEVEVVEEAFADPFAASPAPSARATPVTMAPSNMASTRSAPAKKIGTEVPAWLAHWPLAAVAAVVLLALPLLTFLFTSMGQSGQPSLIIHDAAPSESNPAAGAAASQVTANLKASQKDAATTQNNLGPSHPSNAQIDQATVNPPSVQVTHSDRQQRSGLPNDLASLAPPRPAVDPGRESSAGSQESALPPSPRLTTTASQASSPVSVRGHERGSAQTVSPPPGQSESTPAPTRTAMKWTTISTADGRGADAMVQNGSNQKHGLNLSVGVRTRSGVESNHTYLRFDLAGIEETRRWTKAAELVLSIVGNERPFGANLRVYALDVGLWPEDSLDWKKSFSSRGLDSLPLLAEITVGPDADPRDAGFHVIRIASPQLAAAIAKSTHDTLTLVLAGSGPGDSMLRFVSREQAASSAPRLEIQTPDTPPESPPGRPRG